jgi:glutamate-ammonia-ligase adenylyltransferase
MILPFDPGSAGAGVPRPSDFRRLALGRAAWLEALTSAADDPVAARARAWSATPAGGDILAAIFGNSPFLAGLALREWRFLSRLVEEGGEGVFEEIAGSVERRADAGEDTAGLMRRLRRARGRVALTVAICDLASAWPLERQMAALSRFAEAAVGAALRHLLRQAHGAGALALTTIEDPEHECGLFILGLGKLGGRELNYSSDIDLIVLYDGRRARVAARAGRDSFFVRLTRDLVRLLAERTSDGYVFRVDLRLRPDPASTPLAMSVAAALAYYESVGQNWERAALSKARPIAGDRAAAVDFLGELRPFLWRRHLDFAAIADIHSVKRQIDAFRGSAQIAVHGHNIKTGRGGIREIEFFAQTQQLIWGGRLPELRVGATCEALDRLAATGRIDRAAATELVADYRFLRRLEHRLQMIDDAQTHTLPADDAGIGKIATFLGYAGSDAFVADLTRCLRSVERHYRELFERAPSLAGPGNLVFTGAEDDADTLATLSGLGFADPAAVSALVRGWHHGRLRATRSQRAREILTELIPELLRIYGATPHPDAALQRFDRFVARLSAGVPLLALFHANPSLLRLLADIMSGAPRLSEQLAARPALLDAALGDGFFAAWPGLARLGEGLDELLAAAGDFADALDALRRWAGERRFQVGVQLLGRTLTGPAAGAALADIAEAALGRLVPVVETEFARRHGRVPQGSFAVIGMGRLGSREMTLASDLDLIVIYDAPPDSEISDGEARLATATYYARLSQRLIGAITAPTGEGRLYEVDMRLRPSGASGPIASNLDGFVRYQREAAWTWEHMALTRARPVAGDAGLQRRLAETIGRVLAAPRDPRRLVLDIADMRRRIARENPRASPFDLKNRRGGLLDLEFVVQYLMLREAAAAPEILRRGSADAIAALGAAGILPAAAVHELGDALNLLQQVSALSSLFGDRPVAGALSEPDAAALARTSGAVDFAALDANITAATHRVRGWYERLIAEPARHAARRAAQTKAATTRGDSAR